MPKSLCHIPSCQNAFIGSTADSHRKEFHSAAHKLPHNGLKVKVSRRPDGKLPCPCGSELHARYSFKKLTALTRLRPHPLPEESPHADHDVTDSDTLPPSSHSNSVPFVDVPLIPTSGSNNGASQALPSNDIEMQKGCTGEGTGEPVRLNVVAIVAAGEDEEEFGGIGDRSTGGGDICGDDQGSEEGSEYQDEPPETTSDVNEMDIDSTSTHTTAAHAHSLLAKFNILVEPVYRLAICTECNRPVPFNHMREHQWQTHYKGLNLPSELRLPSKAVVLSLLGVLGADCPEEIPYEAIPRIQGIETVPGYRCLNTGCGGAVFGKSRSLRRHHAEAHSDVEVGNRQTIRVTCQPLSVFRKDLRYVEIIPDPKCKSKSLLSIEQSASACNLLENPEVFNTASNEREKNAVFAQSRWDELLEGVNIAALRQTISTPDLPTLASFKRLRLVAREYYEDVSKSIGQVPVLVRRYIASSNPNDLKHKPFRRPQEVKTVIEDAYRTAQFVAFLITTHQFPVDSFPVPLHPSLQAQLKTLRTEVEDENCTISQLKETFHESVWLILSCPSDEYLRDELMCPFTRFLIAVNLKDSGAFVRASVIPPIIAQPQWCFRATALKEVLKRLTDFNGDPLLTYQTVVQRFITDGRSVLFTTLRQNMNLFRALATRQQGLARFNWNIGRSVITIDGFPISVSSFVDGVRSTIVEVEGNIRRLFCGCLYDDILQHIDEASVPHKTGQPRWFRDRPTNNDFRYSFFEEAENGFENYRSRLLDHLSKDPRFFITIDNRTVSKNGAILKWFSDLDEIVRQLYYLISTTWGGGSRGTEIERLLYANNSRNTRNVFVINGLLTIVTEYQKTQSLTGAGKLIARTPAFQVNRLLMLILGVAYWAAGYIGCYIGMERSCCQRYFYEVFVLTGKPMESKDFSKVLGSMNGIHLGIDLKLQDFRQLMSCLLISSTSTSFFDPNEEDQNVVAAHESFGHSVEMGRSGYGLDSTSATGLAADAVARMQQVCLKWQAFLNVLHPLLNQEISREHKDIMTNSTSTNALITSHFQDLLTSISERFDGFEVRTRAFIRSEIEYLGTHILEQIRTVRNVPSYRNPRRPAVHPSARDALKAVLRRKYNPSMGFTSAEQAELVNSVGSALHVFGIIETGGGKSLAFLGAPFLFPRHLFVVVSPLIALTQDLRRRLLETGINGGVWQEDSYDEHTAQLILVSAHKAGSDEFYNWLTCDATRQRLKRIFIDEAHKVVTDSDFRSCFKRFPNLVRSSVPITFLSGSLMPRSMPFILEAMEITDAGLVDEIRRYSGRPNLKYSVEKIQQEDYLEKIRGLVSIETRTMVERDRGIIFLSTLQEARDVRDFLGFPMYTGGMNDLEREESERRWRRGVSPEDRWIVATQAFGQGVDYPHVRAVLHKDPRELINYYQESGRAGRDGSPGHCLCLWSQLPFSPKDPSAVDHVGRLDMILFLQTLGCLRMALAAFDRELHSCVALNGELCSNCEKLSLNPYALSAADVPRFDKKLVPINPSGLNGLAANSVAANAGVLNSNYDNGEKQLREFNAIMESVVLNGCPDCWVAGHFHSDEMVHDRFWGFASIVATLKGLKMQSTAFWPFCYECWVPFRRPCNHPPPLPGKRIDPERCLYRISDKPTGEFTALLPTLVALIFTSKDPGTGKRVYLDGIKDELNCEWGDIGQLSDWLRQPIENSSQVPHPVLFLITFWGQYELKKGVSGPAIFQCPLCELQALKGQIWQHFVDKHNSEARLNAGGNLPSSGSTHRPGDDLNPPPAKKRKIGTPVSSSPSLGASSTFTADVGGGLVTPPTSSLNVDDPEDKGTEDDDDDSLPATPSPIVLDTDVVFDEHPTMGLLFEFLNEQLSTVVRTCPYEQIMLGAVASDHDRLWKCSTTLLSDKQYEYKRVFTLGLTAGRGCCYKCWTPQHPEFNHSDEPCAGGPRSDWEGWWRAVPYLIWRTTYLREVVFQALGIPSTAFYHCEVYAAWLTQPAHDIFNAGFNRKVTNLVAVVYTYFKLLIKGEIVRPAKGLTLDPYSPTTTTRCLKFVQFDLSEALQEDGKCRIEVERQGLTLEDEEVEFEEVEEGGGEENRGESTGLPNITLRSSPSNSSNSQCPSLPKLDSPPSTKQRASSKRNRKTAASRSKRATAAKLREGAAELKEHAIRVAQDAAPLALKDFDMSSLPAGFNGWTAAPTETLSPGLKKIWRNLDLLSRSSLRLLEWDGVSRIVLLDSSERVIAVLGVRVRG
ncbi:dna partial [Lentinula edodes]|uniref:DNA 3'-5' helicase n=1 Tax=Lentinula edodes TaxID=5353 RepID=A0A1Q3DUJ9_LENED|nr:dna partial [Lentinula edodes]